MADGNRDELQRLRRLRELEQKASGGQEPASAPAQEGWLQEFDSVLRRVPGVPQLAELGAGMARGTAGVIDFFGPDSINEIFRLAGSETRIPTARQSMQSVGLAPERGAFVGDGLQADVLGAAGEVIPSAVAISGGLRSAASQLPQIQERMVRSPAGQVIGTEAEGAIRGILRQLGSGPTTTAGMVAQDAVTGAVSGAGGAIGENVAGPAGQIVGAVIAPVGFAASQGALRSALSNRENANQLVRNLGSFSDEGAAKILAEAMQREGVSPDDVAKMLDNLGPEGMPADIGPSFRRLLRVAANELPRIDGRGAAIFAARQSGQPSRLASALDDVAGVPGLTLDDELARMERVFGPVINDMYRQARSKPLAIPPNIQSILTNSPDAKDAYDSAQRVLANRRAVGDQIGHLDVIDAVKQKLDDSIGAAVRTGERNRARDLVRIKNTIVSMADEAIPEYGQARQLFAGKVSLETAADLGQNYLKLSPREMRDTIATMGESELRMFRLGAKQAILDRVDMTNASSDAFKRIFGRNGDINKLRMLFPDEQAFDAFQNTMLRELTYKITENAFRGNSTTIKQGIDAFTASDAFDAMSSLQSPQGAVGYIARVLGRDAQKRARADYLRALEKAADVLLDQGYDATRFAEVLRAGNSENIRIALERALLPNSRVSPALPATVAERMSR